MADVVSLGIAVDTKDVKEATKALDELAAAADRAEAALRRLGVKNDAATVIKAVKDARVRNILP